MRQFSVLLGMLGFVAGVHAQVVGSFSDSRLSAPEMNLASGPWLAGFREALLSRGAPIVTTDTLTPGFLAGISVFVTSEFISQVPSQAEVDALVTWVRAGGTLVVTGECG